MQYSNVVINLAGQSFDSRHYTMTDVNVEGARNIARAAKAAGAERLIHVSALGASPDSPCAFMRSKAAGEAAVLAEFPTATIIRPAPVFGVEDKLLSRLAALHRAPLFVPLPNDGAAIKQPVFCVDVAKGIFAAVTDAKAPGTLYEFVGSGRGASS